MHKHEHSYVNIVCRVTDSIVKRQRYVLRHLWRCQEVSENTRPKSDEQEYRRKITVFLYLVPRIYIFIPGILFIKHI